MQTFLPYPDFKTSAQCLDWRRLGKQRIEAMQILRALENHNYGWQNHPAVNMWRGFEAMLAVYHNTIIEEWKTRGYRNSMKLIV
ncbi:MAG: MSMEG_6728 family protein, partial [Dehalococcoidia bacterium]